MLAARCSPSRLDFTSAGSEVLREQKSAAQPFAIGYYRHHHLHHNHNHTTTATSRLDSNPGDKNNTLRAPPTQQFLRPRGQTTTAAMSQFVGQVRTYHHFNHFKLPSLIRLPPPDPPRLLTRVAPRRCQHRPTPSRPPGLLHRHHPHGQAQTHLRPQYRLRRLRRHYRPIPAAHHRQEDAEEEILLAHHPAR